MSAPISTTTATTWACAEPHAHAFVPSFAELLCASIQGAGDAYCNTAVMATACAQAEAQYGENPALWPAAAAPLGFCDIPCVQELMDCHDDPRIANTGLGAEDIATVAALCGSVDPCADITEQMLPTMNTVCCSEPGACNEDGVPQTCSQDCADIYVPFWEECSHFMGQNADLVSRYTPLSSPKLSSESLWRTDSGCDQRHVHSGAPRRR